MRRLFTTLLLATAAVLSVANADDLDTLLAQPPSASLTPGDAKHRIEMLRAFIADHPDRADEIEAYLIPFVRVIQPPAVAPAPPAAPPPAKPKPLLLIRSPDGTASTMRAISFRKQGGVLIVVGEKGSRAVFQASTIAGELPWFTDKELESGAVGLKETAGRYDAYAAVVPALGAELRNEAARLRAMQQAKDDAAAKAKAAIEERVAKVTTASYDPASGYTAASLGRLLLDAEKVRSELPEFSERIDAWSAPFHEHFIKLLSGFSYVDGQWVSNADLARQAYEKRQAAFLSGLDYRIEAQAIPDAAVRGFVTPFVVKVGLALFAGLAAIVFGWRRILFRIAGAVLVMITAIGASMIFFLATRNPPLLPASIPPGEEKKIVDLLSQAAGLESPASEPQKISDAELNGFVARHVRISEASTGPDRQSVALRFLPGRIAIFEMVRSMGLNWIVRLDLTVQMTGGAPAVTLAGAKLGALDCPRGFASALWSNLEPQLSAILSSSHVIGIFAAQSPNEGAVEVRPAAKTEEP